MKKLFVVLISVVLSFISLFGCNSYDNDPNNPTTTAPINTDEGVYKVLITGFSDSF